jgi:hypothetical protein
MAKKIEVIVDVNTDKVEISSDRVLTLTEQVRILKKEIQKAGPGPEQDLLIQKFNDVNDELDKTNLKSREFLGALSTLPGPVGEFAGSLDGAVNQLRNFTSFSFKDIKTQLGGLADDFGKIVTNIGRATGITKIYTTLNNALAGSFVKVGIGEQAAAAGARAFSAALVATGIGALIVGLGLAVSALMDYANAAETAAEKQKELNEQQDKMAKETLDVETQSLKRSGDLLLASEKARGASAQRIYQIEQQNRELLLNSQKRYYNSLSSLDSEEGRKTVQLIKNTENEIKVAEQNFRAEQLKEQKSANEKKQQENKQHRDKIAADNKTADDTALSLARDNAVLAIQDERKRQDAELQNLKLAEEDKIKALEISNEKKASIIAQIETKYRLKQSDVDKKRKEEDLKAEEEFNRKVADIKNAAIQEEVDRAIAERQQKLANDLADLEVDKEFIKKSETEKAEIRKNLTTASENEINKIKFDAKMNAAQDELAILEAQQRTLIAGTDAYYQNSLAIENTAYQMKIDAAKGNAKKIEAINIEHTQNLKNIDLAAFEAKKQIEIQRYQVVAGIGASLQQLAGKNKALAIGGIVIEKAAAIGQIFANNAIANAKATAASPLTFGQPWVTINTVAAVLSSAATVAAAAKAISEINGQSSGSSSGSGGGPSGFSAASLGRNYGDGGMIEGPRHAAGGVLINAEGGEAVMTRGAVTMFAPLLSQLNQMGGGTSFSSGAIGGARPDNAARENPAASQSPVIMKTYVVSNELTTQAEKQARLKDLSTL